MEKKPTFSSIFANIGKGIKDVADQSLSAIKQAADQNGDGTIDATDFNIIADSVSSTLDKGAQTIGNVSSSIQSGLKDLALRREKENLAPLFPEDLALPHFSLPKFITVSERDKKHADSPVCQGSIGYTSIENGLKVIHIFRDSVDSFGLHFISDEGTEFFLVDPSDSKTYISLNDYFGFLKVARISELQKLAQDLGAKHFRVTYKEEQSSFTSSKEDAKINAKIASINADGSANGVFEKSESKYSTVEIAAEMYFPGHNPVQPHLKYMKNDTSISTLVQMRMDESSPLLSQKYSLKLSNTSGIKEHDAIKIDGALKSMKVSGNATLQNEVKNEARRYLEYEIEF